MGQPPGLPRVSPRPHTEALGTRLGGVVGQKFPNDEKNFRIYHGILSHESVCYSENEDTIYKQKYAYFTHRHITEAVR